jgi:hypothetical protein
MKIKLFPVLCAFTICASAFFSGCAGDSADIEETAAGSAGDITETPVSNEPAQVQIEDEDYYFDWQNEDHETIDLSGGSKTITQSGIYEIKGTLEDGSLTVDIDKDTDSGIVYLVLNGADISCPDSAPIYIMDAEKAVIILEDGSENNVSQGSEIVESEDGAPNSAIFSKSDLTITGGGELAVSSEYNDGINCRDTLIITGGTIAVNAAGDGIVGKDLLAIKDAELTIEAGKDGMRSTNGTDEGLGNIVLMGGVFEIDAGSDGIQAENLLQIENGTYDIVTGGGYTGSYSNGGSGDMGQMPAGGGQMPGGMGNRPESAGQAPGSMGGTPPEVDAAAADGAAWQAQTAADSGQTFDGQVTETTEEGDGESYKALKGESGIVISDGSFSISSADDAMHSGGDVLIEGGTYLISTDDDGMHSDTSLVISAGEITVENSYEGMEAANIEISGGSINIKASDDAFNVNSNGGLLTISGGEIYLDSGGDGLDSNGSVEMIGGTVYVDGPVNGGNGPLDYTGSFSISNGLVIASGSSQMAQAPNDGSQPAILMYYGSTQAAGTVITLKDESGNTIASFTPSKEYSSVAISAPGLLIGSSYTLYSGDTALVSFEISEQTTYLNESGVTTGQGATFGGGGGFGRAAGGF